MQNNIKIFSKIILLGFLFMILSGCSNTASQPDQQKYVVNPDDKEQNILGNQKNEKERTPSGDKLTVSNPGVANESSTTKTYNQPPTMQIYKNKVYTATMKTAQGDITIELNAKETPITVNNFVVLAKDNFYNNTIFHRVMKGFMIQGGDPKGNGTGGPGYKFDDEPFSGEYTRGTVAMANSGPNTNGSQFFIMHQNYDLPKNYVIFGKVTEGMDVVDKIAQAEVSESLSGEMSKPVKPVTVLSVDISEK